MPNWVQIDDPDDDRIAGFRNIRERDLVGRQNRFIAEGKVVLRIASQRSRHDIESVLVLDRKVPDLGGILGRLKSQTPVFVAPQPVLDTVAGFHLHRGVVAMCRKSPSPDPATLLAGLPEKSVVLLLSSISNHDNMGGIFRNAAAFDAGAVLLDSQCCDPLYRKSIRVSVGGALVLPFASVESPLQAISLLTKNRFEVFALSPSARQPIESARFAPRTAFVLGSEGAGLADEVLAAAEPLRIAMSDRFDSLNVAAASAIALHRYRSSVPPPCPGGSESAPPG